MLEAGSRNCAAQPLILLFHSIKGKNPIIHLFLFNSPLNYPILHTPQPPQAGRAFRGSHLTPRNPRRSAPQTLFPPPQLNFIREIARSSPPPPAPTSSSFSFFLFTRPTRREQADGIILNPLDKGLCSIRELEKDFCGGLAPPLGVSSHSWNGFKNETFFQAVAFSVFELTFPHVFCPNVK